MIFDIYEFESFGQLYCYDIHSGAIFRSNSLLSSVMKYYSLDKKDIIKKLKIHYSAKEIIETVQQVEQLEKSKVLHKKVLKYVTYDHANLVSLKKVYYENMSDNVREAYKKLQKKFHSKEGEIQLLQFVEIDKKISENVNDKDRPLIKLNSFIEKWNNRCSNSYSNYEVDEVKKAVEALEINVPDVKAELTDKDLYNKIPALISLLRRIYQKEKKIFPCHSGIDELVVDEDGRFYNCIFHLKEGIEKKINELGCLFSVFDLEKCRDCFARFHCGGYCHLKSKQKLELCDVFCRVFLLLIKISTYIADKEESLKEQIIGSNV